MRSLAAIVFDFDGVIADSERLHLRAYQELLAELGLPLTTEAYYQTYLGYDDVGVFRRYAREHDLAWDDERIRALVAEKSRRYEQLVVDGRMIFPGVAEFVHSAATVVPLAIASGALTHEIEDILERTSLRSAFSAVVGADQTMRSKPSPDPYLEAVHRLAAAGHAVTASRAVAIEDSIWGLVSARTAGLRCVAVTNTYPAGELCPHADLVIDGFQTLTLDVLDSLVEKAYRA